jgi:hypothetical protein
MGKRILNLPAAAEINMIIGCGILGRIWRFYGERFRKPFEEVYFKL